MKKIQQKSAFLLSYLMRHCDKSVKPVIVKSHEYPLFIINSYKEVISFLTDYTKYSEFKNGDVLRMKSELKDACFIIEIDKRELFKENILCHDVYGVQNTLDSIYNEHYISVHRIPVGIVKKVIDVEFY